MVISEEMLQNPSLNGLTIDHNYISQLSKCYKAFHWNTYALVTVTINDVVQMWYFLEETPIGHYSFDILNVDI